MAHLYFYLFLLFSFCSTTYLLYPQPQPQPQPQPPTTILYPPWRIQRDGPLLTRFSTAVQPNTTWQQYPRPALVRGTGSFLLLNGLWQLDRFADPSAAPPFGQQLPEQILVPYPVESALSGIRRQSGRGHLWYRRLVRLPAEGCLDRHVLLRFEACDWNTTVYVNGVLVGSHIGGYDAFAFDISDVVDCANGKANDVLVHVVDLTGRQPTDPPQALGKQWDGAFHRPGGIYYTGSSGIWQTVWVEFVPKRAYVEQIHARTLRSNRLVFTTTLAGESNFFETVNVVVEVKEGARTVGRAQGEAGKDVVVQMPDNAKWWSPVRPFLYNVSVQVVGMEDTGEVVDEVSSYVGLRTMEVGVDAHGIPRPLLNGKFVFQVGTLDQGFWPDGIYTAPSDEALMSDIIAQKAMGFNLIRKHVKVEPRRWYFHCDRLGMLVWQDMPSFRQVDRRGSSSQFWKEAQRHIQQLRVHPSIVQWVVYNEGWGQPNRAQTQAMVARVQALDRSRLVDALSGVNFGGDTGVGSVIDLHHYSDPAALPFKGLRFSALGEYGGIGMMVAEHSWVPRKCFMYVRVRSTDSFLKRFRTQQASVLALKQDPTLGLSASIYTQFSDVEAECNGLYTYDRNPKLNLDLVRAANLPLLNTSTNTAAASVESMMRLVL